MLFEWDERKRLTNIAKHRLDFQDAVLVLAEDYLKLPGKASGDEIRHRAVGRVRLNIVTVIYTERGGAFRIISMRRARDDERELFHQALYGG